MKRRTATVIGVTAVVVEAVMTRVRAGWPGGELIVRCRSGHLFSTIWIPGASLKSVRLGWWRFQRCPVGRHWTVVTPVRPEALSPEEARAAAAAKDVRLP
jgi:hypothetical protein